MSKKSQSGNSVQDSQYQPYHSRTPRLCWVDRPAINNTECVVIMVFETERSTVSCRGLFSPVSGYEQVAEFCKHDNLKNVYLEHLYTLHKLIHAIWKVLNTKAIHLGVPQNAWKIWTSRALTSSSKINILYGDSYLIHFWNAKENL